MQQEKDEDWRLSGLPLVFHALGRRSESDSAFEWFERAYAQRDCDLTEIKCSRLLRGLASDPRYKAFLRKLNHPE